MQSSMLMQAKNAVGLNTAGAASLFHVLRTYRHAAGEKRKAEVNAKARALHL